MLRFGFISLRKALQKNNSFSSTPLDHLSKMYLSKPSMDSIQKNKNKITDEMTGGNDSQSNPDKIRERLVMNINNSFQGHQYGQILRSIKESRTMKVQLSFREYLIGLRALCKYQIYKYEDGKWLIDVLMSEEIKSSELLSLALTFCKFHNESMLALAILKEYEKTDFKLNQSQCILLLQMLTVQKPRKKSFTIFDRYYEVLKSLPVVPGSQELPKFYCKLTEVFCEFKEDNRAIQALRDLTDAGYTPTASMCYTVLERAIQHRVLNVSRVIFTWFLNNFTERLELGILNQGLIMSSNRKDFELAKLIMQLLPHSGYPTTGNHYIHLIQIQMDNNDYPGALETLQEMESNGIELLEEISNPDPEPTPSTPLTIMRPHYHQMVSIQNRIVKQLCYDHFTHDNVQRIDDLYFGLIELVRAELKIPKVALDAMVEACGHVNTLDRAFATFDEYETVFHIKPDIHSYNALLKSCASVRIVNIYTLLSVFESMNQLETPIPPDATSFSILLEAIAESDQIIILDDILGIMASHQIVASPRSLRRCIVTLHRLLSGRGFNNTLERLANHLNEENVETLQKNLIQLEDLYLLHYLNIPRFFDTRLKKFRKFSMYSFETKIGLQYERKN